MCAGSRLRSGRREHLHPDGYELLSRPPTASSRVMTLTTSVQRQPIHHRIYTPSFQPIEVYSHLVCVFVVVHVASLVRLERDYPEF